MPAEPTNATTPATASELTAYLSSTLSHYVPNISPLVSRNTESNNRDT